MSKNDDALRCAAAVREEWERNKKTTGALLNAADHLDRLVAENEAQAALLRELEWAAGGYNRFGDGEEMCPCCEQWKSDGHKADCKLSAAIRQHLEGKA